MRNIAALRTARRGPRDDAQAAIDRVMADLRADVGETVTKASAARLLGVSRTTLDKWVARGAVPTRSVGGREEVLRAALEELVEAVNELRRTAAERPGALAEAVRRLADGDPEIGSLEPQGEQSLSAAERGALVPLRIPEGFGPDD